MIKRGILLAIAPRNNNDANGGSGNHALDPAEIDRQILKKITNKCKRSATTALQSKGPRTGSPTLPMNKMTLKNSSCSRCWELRGRIFKALKPDGLGKSYSL